MRTLSCGASLLYGGGGFVESRLEKETWDEQAGDFVHTVYPTYAYDRPLPAHVLSNNPDTPPALAERYRTQSARYTSGALTGLFELHNVILYDRTLYAIVPPGEIVTVYETDRDIDKPWKTALEPELLKSARRPNNPHTAYVYCSSVGSENYAHWLVDDLTRTKPIRDIVLSVGSATVILDAYFPQIDEIRKESIDQILAPASGADVMFVEKKIPYYFERLFYVSPSSYAALLKSPDGVKYVCETLAEDPGPAPRRLFVGRNAFWRNLLNAGQVAEFFTKLSFEAVTISFGSMSFLQQRRLFAGAEVVVGVAGASMVNTLFCPPSTRVVYLAGEGFVDPWYWDLAAVKGHEYSVCFGDPWKPDTPNFSSFTIAEAQLRKIAEWL
jgi:hypothetical protein